LTFILEWFDDKVLGTGLHRLDDQRLLAKGAAHDDAGVGVLAGDLLQRLDAALERHDNIHGHQVRPQLMVPFNRLDTVDRLADYLKAGFDENVPEHVAHEQGIVRDQNPKPHGLLLTPFQSSPGSRAAAPHRAD
jgi:hypothetical protein